MQTPEMHPVCRVVHNTRTRTRTRTQLLHPRLVVRFRRVADSDKVHPVQAGPAYQEAVHIFAGGDLHGVARIDGAAVLDAHVARNLRADLGGKPRSNAAVHLLRLVRRGHAPGADGPDGLCGVA